MFIIKPSQPAFKSSWVSGKKKKKKKEICDFWVHDRTRDQEQNGNPSAFRQSFENENGRDRLFQEKLLRFRNFASMAKKGRFSFLLEENDNVYC